MPDKLQVVTMDMDANLYLLYADGTWELYKEDNTDTNFDDLDRS